MKIGLSILPAVEFARLFQRDLSQLLKKSLPMKQRWFAIIRNARILHKDPRLVQDEFSFKGPLKTWAGILDHEQASDIH